MMKTMLSGTAIALLLVANPALAQTTTDDADDDQVQIEAQDEPTAPEALDEDDETAAEMDDPDDDVDAAEIDDPDDDIDAAEMDDPDDDVEAAEIEDDVDDPDVAEVPERPTETYFDMQEEDEVLASELMGANVENPEGETLGSISDVIIHEELGVKGVVVGVGGFLGIGQKRVAVNFDEIEQVRDNGDVTLVFAGTRDDLENAPEFRTLQDQMAEAEQDQMQMEQPAGDGMSPPAGGGTVD